MEKMAAKTSYQTDTVQNPRATVLKYSSGTWESTKNYSLDPQKILSLPERCYIFLDKKSYPKSESGREDLLHYLNVPDFLYNKTCTELNGYFGCRGIYNEERKLESYSTWFRCLVKMVREEPQETQAPELNGTQTGVPENKQADKAYLWYEMGFFTRWDHSGHCKVVCIDTPEELQSGLETVLRKQSPPLNFSDPFAMHIPLIDQIILQYDVSVWRVRHPVRKIEKSRLGARPDFGEMHEISRHAIHVSEVLSVTIETMEGIQRQQGTIYGSLSSDLAKTHKEQAQEYLSFQLQILKSLKLRSISNHERLKNEITLAYNMIARQDNAVVKSIALLTMIFLPATFVSALFSTTFFTFGDDGWKTSHQLWVYWVITIPSTILIMVIWRLWLYGPVENPFTSHSFKKFSMRTHLAKPKGSGLAV